MDKWIRSLGFLFVVILLLGCSHLISSEIIAVVPQEKTVEAAPNETISFSVTATDPHGDDLLYLWEHTGSGTLTRESATTATWQAPHDAGTATVKVTVTNSIGALTSHTWKISITEQPATDLEQAENDILAEINRDRKKEGLGALQRDANLTRLAREYSEDMARNGYFSHTSPTLGTFSERMEKAGYVGVYLGENLAFHWDTTLIHAVLMDSSGHRANILNTKFTHIGIGLFEWEGHYYATQIFLGR